MADFHAIANVCEAVIELLRNAFNPADFPDENVDFKVYSGSDFNQSMWTGISLFLYRVLPNNIYRMPSGKINDNGRKVKPGLPLDLHILLTVWAPTAIMQHKLLGWAMRTLEDTPIIPQGLLNARIASVFRSNETVEIAISELSTEDLFRIWETITENKYQLSVPYVARLIIIESKIELPTGLPVQQRIAKFEKELEDEI